MVFGQTDSLKKASSPFVGVSHFSASDTLIRIDTKEGEINIYTSPEMDSLFDKYILLSEEKRIPIKGYRVQIASASGNNAKSSVNSVKSSFLTNFPDSPAYLIWESPNYKIRVGDFRTKLDAEKFQRQIDDLFPYAFIVRDNINFPELERNEEE